MEIIQPFFENQILRLSLVGRENPGLSASAVMQMITPLVENPYLKINEMDIEMKKRWTSYDVDKLSTFFGEQFEAKAGLRNQSPPKIYGSFAKNKYQNTLNLEMGESFFEREWLGQFKDFVYQLVASFPKFSYARASSDDDTVADFYLANDLEPLPMSVGGYLTWYNLLSPEEYNRDFKKEDILKAPAFSVTELNDEMIEMIAYPNPFEYFNEEPARKIIHLTQYLLDKKK